MQTGVSGNVTGLGNEGADRIKMKRCTLKTNKILLSAITFLFCSMLNFGLWQYVQCGPAYQISGFYLGATPETFNIKVETDPLLEEKYYEIETNDVLLFFVKVRGTLRLYRIVKEQAIKPDKVKAVLDSLKVKYGTPDKQQIKTSSVRSKNRASYITTVKNKAIWNISETQEFIAEIESKRVVYELLDHNPEKSKPQQNVGAGEEGELGTEGWDPDN
jgi:hypothetical protein